MNTHNKKIIRSVGFVSEPSCGLKALKKYAFTGLAMCLAGAMSAQANAALKCEHVPVNQWDSGFTANVVITNEGTETVSDWQSVTWQYTDGSTRTSGWSANVTGTNPYTATPLSWNASIAPGASFSFGVQGSPGAPGTDVVNPIVTGPLCSGASTFEGAHWTLNAAESSLHFVSVKKEHVAENQTFNTLDGTIDKDGNAVFAIDLDSINSAVDIRNERMRNFLFETNILPTMYFTVNVASINVDALTAGSSQKVTLPGSLSLHGINMALDAEVIVTKLRDDKLNVSTFKPIIIDTKKFDMNGGIETLRTVANLASIGEAVPVYLSLSLDANSDSSVLPIALADKPAAPINLAASYNTTSSEVGLTWDASSNNESGFIVRRKTPAGLWQTATTLVPNSSNYFEGLAETGLYGYKVIAYNGDIASDVSNEVSVGVDSINPEVLGESRYGETCVACHGVGGVGLSAPALNTPRDEAGFQAMLSYIQTNMPPSDPGSCDADCASQIGAYIKTLWPEPLACDAPVKYGQRQLKLLTKTEYQFSVEDLFGIDFYVADGLSADRKVGFFYNNALTPVNSSAYDKYLTVAEEVAQWSADQNFASLMSCSIFDQSCSDAFIIDAMPAIFRRPLTTQEETSYRALANGSKTEGDVKAGIQLAIQAALSSPQFLYRHELGNLSGDTFELTPYEMATYLSYTFTGTTPDQTLLNKAANNQLATDEQVLAEASRLLNSPAGKAQMGDFVGEWLGTDELEKSLKDQNSWPGFEQLVPHMKQEIRENFASVMLDETEQFASLYDANHTYVNGPLAQHYGISGVTGNDFQRVATGDRGGILRSGAFMARWGEDVESAPFRRAVKVRRRMLCQDMPAPPAGIGDDRQALLELHADFIAAATTTNREKYDILTSTGSCVECHKEWMNPLAFGMEDFDTVGNPRTQDLDGNMIDALGALYAPNNLTDKHISIAFQGTEGLAGILASSTTAQQCVPETFFRYTMGVGVDSIDNSDPNAGQLDPVEQNGYACEVKDLTQTMMTLSPRKMLEQLATMQSVRYRKEWSRQ